jgi:ubiquinone/menaquinone biosynthesis C-methylase UbiE
MKPTWKQLFFSFVAGALGGVGWWLYSRRPQERIPSGHEALDDTELARAYGWIATMPQMRLLRSFVVHRAAQMVERGEAADLGCGPGLLVVELARRSPELHVTGIDLSEEMLAQGEEYARRASLGDRVSFRKGDVKQIPFPDDSLDLVVSTLSLHHWSDPLAVLDEVARVLHPGGSFLIFDLRRDMMAPVYLLLWFAQHVILPAALRRVGEPLGSRNAAYTPEEAAQLAAQSQLRGWRVARSPLWLTIEGQYHGIA